MQHYLTYQHNVQRFFRDHRDKYDGVIIPLSIATSFPSGTFGFIRALCSDQTNKSYAIDPRNALFQKKWNRDNVRDPHRKMASVLGSLYVNDGLRRPLLQNDFSDELLTEHVKQTIQLQLRFSTRSEDARKLEKYRKLLGLDTLGSMGMPQFLMPPYYEFSDLGDHWYRITQRCVEKSLEFRENTPVWPVLHFRGWTEIDWPKLFHWLTEIGLKEFWLYPNDYREHESTKDSLMDYRQAVEAAVQAKLRPYVLFGGYFAILMSYFGMQGFANGIGYGEWRDSGYHRGGSAMKRIYLRKLHRYLDAPLAQDLVNADPDYFGSDTEIIAGYVVAGIPLEKMGTAEALDHFMECRQQELTFVQTESPSSAIDELQETCKRLKKIGPLQEEKYSPSLMRWQSVLSMA